MTRSAWWLGGLAVLVALPASALAIVAATLEPDDYKPRLIAAVQGATGRTLSLDGPLRIRWSLWPTLQVNGARLSNLPGGSRPDMATAERIEAQISLPALLRHRIDVLQLRLVGPNVLFEVVDDKPNWVFAAPATSGTGFDLRVLAAHVQNGMVTSRLPARTRVVGLRVFDVEHPQPGALDLGGTLVYGDNQPLTLHAAASATGGLRDPWHTDITFAAYDTTAHANGTMTLQGGYDLDVDAKSGALDRLNALLPEMGLPAVNGMVLSGHVKDNPVLGSLPVIGPAKLAFDSAKLGSVAIGRTEVALPAPGGAASIATQLRYAGQAVTLSGTVGVPRRPEERNGVPLDLVAKAAGGSLSLAGTVQTEKLRFAGLAATASLRLPALAALRPMLTPALPALTEVKFDGALTIPADARSLGFAKAAVATRQGDVAGEGTIDLHAAAPALQAKLHAERLDLDALLPAFGIDLATPGKGPLADMPLPWALSGGPEVELAATADTATFRHETWRSVAVTLHRDGGKQEASLRVAMPAGPAELSVTADAAARDVPASLSLRAPGIPLALLAHGAGLPGTVSGSARMEAQLHGAGRTMHAFAASLDGPLSITAVDGQLSNSTFLALAGRALKPLGIAVPAQGETALRCLGLVGAASGGVVQLRTIALETTYLSLTGAGQVDLGRESVALKLHPLVEVGGSPVAVPVVVDGRFDAITGRLDASGLDKVGLLIDGLFGGDSPQACTAAGLQPHAR